MGAFEVTERDLGDGVLLLDVRGEFDVGTSVSVRAALARADAAGRARVVVDLTDVPMIDSTALAVLVVAHKRMRRTGRELIVVMPAGGLTAKFQIAGLDRFLTISDSVAQALAER